MAGLAWEERAELADTLEILATLAADEIAGGRAMTVDQVLDYAAAWADQRSRGTT